MKKSIMILILFIILTCFSITTKAACDHYYNINPDGVGDRNEIDDEVPNGGVHWSILADDNDSSLVRNTDTPYGSWEYDTYNMSNLSLDVDEYNNGTLTSVTIYGYFLSLGQGKLGFRDINNTEVWTDISGTGQGWKTVTFTNAPDGNSWNWSKFNDTQLGLGLRSHTFAVSCRKLYVRVQINFSNCPPDPVTNANWSISSSGTSADLTLNWTKGNFSDTTLIRKSVGTYPSSVTDGTLVYNNTGNGTVDTAIDQAYLYTFWGFNWSSNTYSSPVYLNWSATWINVYNESNPSQNLTNWDVEISNEDGTEVYYSIGNNNSLIINISDLPTGSKVTFIFNKTGYSPRVYILSISAGETINLNAYLPPASTTNSYTLQVIDEYSQPVNEALLTIKRYNNISDVYENVSNIVTDGNGYTSCYLVSGQNYKFIISKTGFINEISDWRPTDDDVGIVRVFKIYYVNASGVTIWNNMSVTIEPVVDDYYDNITFYFNITDYDNLLQYCNFTIFYYNNTTLKWDVVYQANDSSSNGNYFSNTTINGVGWYGVQCRFKKSGFEEYTFGYTLYNETVLLYKIFEPYDYGNASYIDRVITGIAGESPVSVGNVIVPYTSLGISVIITILLFTFSEKFAGLGIIIIGIVLGWFRNVFIIIDSEALAISLVVGIIIFGILSIFINKKEE